MRKSSIEERSFSYKTPNMASLKSSFDKHKDDGSDFFRKCEDSYNQYNCWWPGKQESLRRDYAGAKPWVGASDQEVNMIAPRIDTLVSICMNALNAGHITANPVGSDDLERSATISSFIRWMIDSWIPGARDEFEKGLYDLFLYGVSATFVSWEKSRRIHKEQVSIEQIAVINQEFAEVLADPDVDAEVVLPQFKRDYPNNSDSVLLKAINELKEQGFTEIPVIKTDINRPVIQSLSPYSEILLPSYVTNPKDSDEVHCAFLMTPQDLKAYQYSDEWNDKWVNDVIENHMGIDESWINGAFGRGSTRSTYGSYTYGSTSSSYHENLTVVIRSFRRLVNEEDGSVGIYETIWSPFHSHGMEEYYAKHTLLNGWDELPIAFKGHSKNRRFYDQRSLARMMRGTQRQAKVTRDAYTNQQDIALSPPRTYPAGRKPPEWGANAQIPVRTGDKGLFDQLNVPNTTRQGIEYETYLDQEADFICGLSINDERSTFRQQRYINMALEYFSDVVRLAYKAFQKYYDGPDIIFRVTGNPDPQLINSSPIDEEMDISIKYDSRLSSPDYVKEVVAGLDSILQGDRSGRVNADAITDIKVNVLAPMFSNRILMPTEAARDNVLKNVADDLAIIWSGQSIGARQQGAAIALDYLAQYSQKPSVIARIESDAEFAQNLSAYISQYERQQMNVENAQIGALGSPATELQGVNE